MLTNDEQIVKERCKQISNNSKLIDILVGDYYDANPDTDVNIGECNRIKHVVSQPDYLRTIAIDQLQNEGLISTPSH